MRGDFNAIKESVDAKVTAVRDEVTAVKEAVRGEVTAVMGEVTSVQNQLSVMMKLMEEIVERNDAGKEGRK